MIVAHDGARLLPGLINGMREQTHPVHRVVAVDTGSRDRSGATLTELLGPDGVFGMESGTGYGEAVSLALQNPAARGPATETDDEQGPPAEWIWLLHDDCEPAADALEQMLRVADRSRSTAVLGPKLKDPAHRRVLREAGITVDRAGRRCTGVEPGEIDQGQHDGNRQVPAVSSAGMLIRRDVWDQTGGFDPNLPLFRDDIDFCWRVHAVGYEVRVVTDAVVYHRDLSARQLRRIPAAGGNPRLLDRRSALYVFAVNLPFGPLVTIVGGCAAGSVVRAAYFLVTKQQRKAWAHLGAVAWLLRHPALLWRARRRRAANRKQGWAVLRAELPSGRTLARLAEGAAGLLSSSPGYESGGLHHALTDEPGDDLPVPAADSLLRRVLTSPGVLLCAGLVLVALVAERSLAGSVLTGSGTLKGGVLVPAWGGASDLWREYLAGYHDAGTGSVASAPPYLALMAALATLIAGKTWLATDLVLFGCVPAAGMTAFLAAGRITSVLAARCWIAATYALLPVAIGAVATGRIGTAVAFVVLPLIGLTVGRMLTGPPRAARRAAWTTGLLVGVAAAFVPLIWPIAVASALGVIVAWPRLGRAAAVNAAIVAAVPAVVLIPWTFHLLTSPSAFLLEAGVPRPGPASAGLRPDSVLLLSPGGPGLPPTWVTVGLVLPAFCALLARRRLALVYAGWGVALSGMAITLVVSGIWVTPPLGGIAVSAWPGIATAIAATGLLLAATPLIEAAGEIAGRTGDPAASRLSRTGGRRLAALAGLAVAASAPVLAAGYWLAAGVRGPLTAAGPQVLPAFVAAASSGPDRSRTLVLRQDGGVLSYTVLRNTDPVLGEPELAGDSSATHALDGVVAALAAAAGGDGGDTGPALSQFDIGYVLLPAPIDQALAHQLNGAAGLVPLTVAPAYDLWQVAGMVARVRVIGADGTAIPVPSGPIGVQADIAAGTSGTLALAEVAGGWSATLNGRPLAKLAAPVDGWAQGWVLPVGGGRLVITRDETARDASLAAEAVAVLVVFALALPGTRSALPAPASEAGAEPQAETTPAPGRRRDRASGPRLARHQPRPQLALAASRASGADAVGVAEFSAADGDLPDPGPSDGYGPGLAMTTEPPADDGAAPPTEAGAASPTEAGAALAGVAPPTEAGAASPTEAGAALAGVAPPTEAGAAPPTGSGAAPAGAAPPTEDGTATADAAPPPKDDAPAADDATVGVAAAGAAPPPEAGAAAAGTAAPGSDLRAGALSGPPRRSRGGQHAARHGKPSRRWRGRPAARPAAGPPEVVQPPAVTASDLGGTSLDRALESVGSNS
ncbi:MAG TPA: glycosyltransferase, partial [Streptosporangiaceae bacterium]|nr:glycosyltransferase [Streptosporangiaceae bacterium]